MIVELRQERESPAIFDSSDEPAKGSRQRRSAAADPTWQTNRKGQFDETLRPFRDIPPHRGLPFVRAGPAHWALAACAAILYYLAMPDKKRTARLDWEDVRYFVALARHHTLSATSRALRVNHTTVARRIASLESLLGRVLFDRRADGYVLTAEGKAVLNEASAMDEAALSVLRRADAGSELSGLVRLAVGRVLAEQFLIDRLHSFHERYPAIDLEVIGGSRVVSLARREADIALRYGSPQDSELLARRVARIAFGYFASPAYRDKLNAGQRPAFIGFDAKSDFIPEASWLARQFGNQRFSFRTNSQMTQAAAARAGYGVALLPKYIAANDEPDLVQLPMGDCPPERDVWLLIRRDLAKVPRVRAVADYLVEVFQRERRRLSG